MAEKISYIMIQYTMLVYCINIPETKFHEKMIILFIMYADIFYFIFYFTNAGHNHQIDFTTYRFEENSIK